MLKGVRSALVTGGSGFIGSALNRRLASHGVRVFSLSRATLESPDPRITVLRVPNYSSAELTRVLSGLAVDIVFNLASAGVNPDKRDVHELIEGNVGVIANLIAALGARPGLKFFQIGSCSEYAPGIPNHKLTEDHPLQPNSAYGAAKASAFLLGRVMALAANMHFVALRLFGVFGTGEARTRLVPYVIDHLKCNKPVDLTGGEQVRDLLYIDDVLSALEAVAAQNDLSSGSVYNVCSGTPVKIREVALAVADIMKKSKSLLQFGRRPYREDEPMWLAGCNRRFREATNWSPNVSLHDGLKHMIGRT